MTTLLKDANIVSSVVESTQTTGTGTLDLDGAVAGFRGFGGTLTDGKQVYYLIEDNPEDPTEYEIGYGTYNTGSPNTLTRDVVLFSSSGTSKISLSSGTTYIVRGIAPAEAFGTAAGNDIGKSIGDVAQYEDDGSGNSALNHPNMPQVGNSPIVESGSNTDGFWVRWADGTQACFVGSSSSGLNGNQPNTWTTTSITFGGVISWTFPKPFVADNQVMVSVAAEDNQGIGSVVGGDKTKAELRIINLSGGNKTIGLNPMAIGNWK